MKRKKFSQRQGENKPIDYINNEVDVFIRLTISNINLKYIMDFINISIEYFFIVDIYNSSYNTKYTFSKSHHDNVISICSLFNHLTNT